MQNNTICRAVRSKNASEYDCLAGVRTDLAVPLKRQPIRLNGHLARRRPGPVEQTFWDADLVGFGLRIQPSGHRAWIVKYVERGRQKKITLGSATKLSATAARGRARTILANIAMDGLPRPVSHTAAPLFGDYVETFWADYARHWKPATQRTNRGIIELHLRPVFAATALDRIRRADVLRWRDDMSARPLVFNRALPVLAAMLNYAEQLGHRPRGSSPCRRTPRYPATLKERYLSPTEYRRLGAVLASVEAEVPDAVAVIRLLLLTGARVSEILTLRWEQVQPPRLHLPDSKTGPKFIYLGSQAATILAGVRRHGECQWVFKAGRGEGPLSQISPQWRRIRRAAAIPDVRLHDLRHSFASVAINKGVSLMLIGRLLGHALPETTARYAHLEDSTIAEAASRVSQSLGQALRARA
jgi:integrase